MRIRDITKDTIFVKKVGRGTYLVDENEVDGIKTIKTTKNPMKARQYTAENLYLIVYNSLDEDNAKRVAKAHTTSKDSYGVLSKYINDDYEVISTDTIDYGYGEDDLKAEKKFLDSIGLGHACEDIQIVVESIDQEED